MEWLCAGPDDRPVSAGVALLSAGSRAVTDWTVQVLAYTVPLMSRQPHRKIRTLKVAAKNIPQREDGVERGCTRVYAFRVPYHENITKLHPFAIWRRNKNE